MEKLNCNIVASETSINLHRVLALGNPFRGISN